MTALETYQYRIQSLEIELRQMGRNGVLSSRAYKKRLGTLYKLRQQLEAYERELARRENSGGDGSFIGELPRPQHCAPDELELCVRYVDDLQRLLKTLYQDLSQILQWVQRAVKGGSLGIFTTFDLSHMKNKLLKLEQNLAGFKYHKTLWESHIKSMVDASKPLTVHRNSNENSSRTLRFLFYHLDHLSGEIMALRARKERANEELIWMEEWLSMQEFRMQQRQERAYYEPQRLGSQSRGS